jgi:hypothetical protein
VKSGGAMAALATLGETATETSGTAATPSSQIPALLRLRRPDVPEPVREPGLHRPDRDQ